MEEVLLIDENGQKVGQVSYKKALFLAKEKGLDLVAVNKDKSVYKICDSGKLKYEKKRKEKQQRAQQKSHKIKEVQFSPNIGDGDLSIKMRKIREFLNDGMKTKVVMKFHRKHMVHKEVGLKKMQVVISALLSDGNVVADSEPKFEGRDIIVTLTPTK